MRTRRLVQIVSALALAAMLGLALRPVNPAFAQQADKQDSNAPRSGGRGPGGRGADRPPSVEGAMKGMNRALKQLRNQITDAGKKEENLKLIGEMERNCLAAKEQPLPGDVLKNVKDPAARAKLGETYRKDMIAAMRELLDIEQNVADGNAAAAKTHLDKLLELRDASHKTFDIKDDD